jgi:hypothetical protein
MPIIVNERCDPDNRKFFLRHSPLRSFPEMRGPYDCHLYGTHTTASRLGVITREAVINFQPIKPIDLPRSEL